MKRRTFLIGVGASSAGGSALLGSGAFSRVESDRYLAIEVAADPDAYVGLSECDSARGEEYADIDGDGHLNVDLAENTNGGRGVNSDSRTWFHDVFRVCNQGTEGARVWVERADDWPVVEDGPYEGEPRVDFYLGDEGEASILGEDNARELGVGECVCIGIKTITHGVDAGAAETLLDELDDVVTFVADATAETAPQPAFFEVSDLDPSLTTVQQGETLDVSTTVTNTGDSSGTQDVELRIDGAVVDSHSLSLDADEAETVTFTDVETADLSPGEHTHAVASEDSDASGTLTVRERPNVFVFFAEDWNWGTVWDDPALETPALDGLAEDGMAFDQAFCSAPSCSPARSAILSGQHFYRTGTGSVLWGDYPEDLPAYPELLAEEGYTVGHAGKGYGPGDNEEAAGPSVGGFGDFLAERSEDEPFCFWDGPGEAHRPFPDPEVDPDEVTVPPYLPDEEAVREDIAAYYADVQSIDEQIAARIEQLEEAGELENTIFLVTADHGFAFPRGKSNLYDSGTRVPLVVHWPAVVDGGQEATELVNFPDVAPTLLDAAGADVPDEMTGESFIDLLQSGSSSSPRDEVVVGFERHVPGQEPPYCDQGCPARAIRTDDYLYVYNFDPDRWPNGTPNYEEACTEGRWIADVDNGPTKFFLYANRDRDDVEANEQGDSIADLYDLVVGKRPQRELYDLSEDPHQLDNVADDPEYEDVIDDLHDRLFAELEETEDPRVVEEDPPFDDIPYTGGGVTYPGDGVISLYDLESDGGFDGEFRWDFEDGLEGWEINDEAFEQKAIGYQSDHSAGIESDGAFDFYIAGVDLPESGQVNAISFYWRETEASFGGGFRVDNSAGEHVVSFATANPEWIVTNPDANDPNTNDDFTEQVFDGDENYGQWVYVEFNFDWDTEEYTYLIEDETNGNSVSGTNPLRNGGDAAEIRIENYNFEWGSGGAMHMWFDDIHVQ